jgi:ABC-2 type transport system permease protein
MDNSNRKQFYILFVMHAKTLMREPAVLFWGIVFPILMALGLGLAFTQKLDTIQRIAVISDSKIINSDTINNFETFLKNETTKIRDSATHKEEYKLIIENKKLGNSTYIFQRTNRNDAIVLLKRGEIYLIIEEKQDGIEYNFDPINSDAKLTYLNLSRIVNNQNQSELKINENVEPLTLKGTRYIDFLIPGLIAMGIMMSSVWGLGYGIIETRSKKLLRRMIATPMKKSYFLISLISVRAIMNFVEAVLLFTFSYLAFDITIQGNILALILIFISGNIGFAGISILTASRTANPEVGNGLINAILTPMIVLSGIFFSYHNFPNWAIGFIKILPLTLLADGIRSIFIEGAGLTEIAIPFSALFITGIITFFIGLKLFRWY